MALQLPNIYTLGQVKVDTSGLSALQGKLLAQKQAKEEALNKYFEKQMGSLSREGIANNDVKDYNKSIEDLKNYWKQNSQDIMKGGEAKINFDNKVQGIKDFVSESKDKKSQTLKYREQFQFGAKTPTDSDMEVLSYMELPVRDPKRINPATGMPYGLSDLSTQIPAFDVSKRNSYFGNISYGIDRDVSKSVAKTKLPSGDIEETLELTYSPKQIKFMQDKAVQSLATDRTARNYYEQLLTNPDDPRLIKLKEVWDKSGLHPNQLMDTPEEAAQADILLEFYEKPPKVQKRTINIPQRAGGGAGGPKTKLEDYFVLNKYKSTEPLPDGSGRQGIRLNKINAADQKIIGKFVIPAYIGGEDWYIVRKPGEWEGDEGKFITDEDLALDQAPKEVKDVYLGGKRSGKKIIKY